MSIVSSQAVGRQATNNAFISKLSYATDLDYQNAQPAFLVNFPDTSRAHIYYNTTLKIFRYHDGTNWKNLNTSSISSSPTSPVLPLISDLWFNTSDNSLNFWDGSAWVNISPSSSVTYLEVRSNISQVISGAGASATKVFNLINYDSSSGWSSLTNSYTIQLEGVYSISTGAFQLCTFGAGTSNSGCSILIRVNGVSVDRIASPGVYGSGGSVLGVNGCGSVNKKLFVGDVVSVLIVNAGIVISSQNTINPVDNYLTIVRIGDI